MHRDNLTLSERVARQEAHAVALRIWGKPSRMETAARAGDNNIRDVDEGNAKKADLSEERRIQRVGRRRNGNGATGKRSGDVELRGSAGWRKRCSNAR